MSNEEVCELRSNQNQANAQGKGKKRSVGWFPASYVKLLESRKEEDAGATAGSGEAVATGAVIMLICPGSFTSCLLYHVLVLCHDV